MYKYFLLFLFMFFVFNFSFSVYTGVSNITDIDLSNYKCDEFINDKGYYYGDLGEYKVYWYEFENKSDVPLYFWQWKTQIIENDSVDINYNFLQIIDSDGNMISGGKDLFLFNYPYFCANSFSVNPGEKVRILTTVEEVGKYSCELNGKQYLSSFSSWSGGDLGIVSDVSPGEFVFNTPTIKISRKGKIFSYRLGILYDKDNNIFTTGDNFLKVVCYNMDVYYCGDGVVSKEFGEECDPNDPNDDGTCLLNCKKECILSEDDIDGDCIQNKVDQCPNIPENINGIEDFDGCPELPKVLKNSKIDVLNCNMCPCPYSDIDSSLWKGDKVKAGLFSENGSIFYIWSLPKLFDLFP